MILIEEDTLVVLFAHRRLHVKREMRKVTLRKREISETYFNLNVLFTEECLRLLRF